MTVSAHKWHIVTNASALIDLNGWMIELNLCMGTKTDVWTTQSRTDIKFHFFTWENPLILTVWKHWVFATFFHLRIIKTFFKREKKNRASRVKMKSFYDLCHTVICVCPFDGFIKLLFFAQSSWGFQICWQMHYTHLYFIVWHWYCQNILCSFQSSKFIFTVSCHF